MKEIKLSEIKDRVHVRQIKPKGVEILKKKIEEVGYLPEHPLLVAPNGNGYTLVGGNHRYEALKELGVESVPVVIDDTLVNEVLLLQRARRTNETAETVIPTTFVDDAELVWRELEKTGMTQDKVAQILGWSREKVAHYNRLAQIDYEAWKIIVTKIDEEVTIHEDKLVTESVTGVTFSERLLRSILSLTLAQQLELVSDLATNEINKKQFNAKAAAYKTRNGIKEYVTKQLAGVPDEFLAPRLQDVDRGGYDADWETKDKPKTEKLIASIQAEWEEKSGTQLIHGDFEEAVLSIEDGLVDLILTDPPYNISDQGKATKKGGQIVNASFGGDEAWDTEEFETFNNRLKGWVEQWGRVLRPGGSLVVFCDRVLISDLWRLFEASGLIPKSIVVWAKDNPNPAGLSRKVLISATEFMLWGVKPGEAHTFNESQAWDRRNVICAPLCSGDERLKDDQGDTLHPTQKPLAVMLPLVEVFSNRGDLILDGFAGAGSSGEAAIKQGRKFIGVEKNEQYFQAMNQRLSV
jgi:ParB/RepB/Spo0J family partition protein